MLRLKFLVPLFVCFNLLNATANNAYAAYVAELNADGNYYSTYDPSVQTYRVKRDYINPLGVYQYTSVAEFSNSPIPYVKSLNGGSAGLTYDVFIQGTPNTTMLFNLSSLYSASHYYIQNESNGTNTLTLNVGIFDSLGTQSIDYRFLSGGNQAGYLYSGNNITINGIAISPTENAYQMSTVSPTNAETGLFSYDDILSSTFLLSLGDSGEARGQVSLSVQGTNVYLDPYFSIDPAYLALNPNAKLSFTPGVGNGNPLSSVPVPAALPLMASALGLFGIARLRNKSKSA